MSKLTPMNTPKLEVIKTARNGQPAVELVVRNANADLRATLDTMGLVPTVGIANRRSATYTDPTSFEAARSALAPMFDRTGNWID